MSKLPTSQLPTDAAGFAAWIKAERDARSWSTPVLADRARAFARADGNMIALTQQTISGFEQGTAKRIPQWIRYVREAFENDGELPRVVNAGQPTTSTALGGETVESTKAGHPTADASEPIEMVGIQHIDMAYGLGTTFAVDYPEIEVMQFPKAWIQTITHSPPSTLTWTRGKGDSMEPTIRDGDLVLLDRSQRVLGERDAMWAFTIGEEAAIKRLRRQGDACDIFSDNASVPPDRQMLRDMNIVGRVVFVGSRK